MPRNAAGTYTLPDPPRQPNTVIDSPDENVTRDDIATELTNSLDRNGRGGMLAPFRIADGTLAAPGLAFLNEPGSGLYRIGAGDWALAVQGAKVMEFTSSGIAVPAGLVLSATISGAVRLPDGALNTPSLSFVNEPTTGLFRPGVGVLTFGVLNSTVLQITQNAVAVPTSLTFSAGGLRVPPSTHPVTAGNDNAGGYPGIGYNWTGAGLETYNYNNTDRAYFIKFDGSLATPAIRFFTAPLGVTGTPIAFDEQLRIVSVNSTVNFISISGAVAGGIPTISTFFSSDPNVDLYIGSKGNGSLRFLTDSGGANTGEQVRILHVGNAVNQITLRGGAAGAPAGVDFGAMGASANINVSYSSKGTGAHTFYGSNTPQFQILGTIAATNWVTVQGSAGGNPLIGASAGFLRCVTSLIVGTASGGGNITPANGSIDIQSDILVSSNDNGVIWGGLRRIVFSGAGYVKMSPTGVFESTASTNHELTQTLDSGLIIARFINKAPTNTLQYGLQIQLDKEPNDSTRYHLYCGYTVERCAILSNGGIRNNQANNINTSDARLKTDWTPYSYAQLEAFNASLDAMEFGRYKLRDQTHDDWNHGYIAQDVQNAFGYSAPELTEAFDMGENDSQKGILAVYGTDFTHINLAVARHELKKLRAEIADLKAKLP